MVNTKNGLKSVVPQVFNFDPYPYLFGAQSNDQRVLAASNPSIRVLPDDTSQVWSTNNSKFPGHDTPQYLRSLQPTNEPKPRPFAKVNLALPQEFSSGALLPQQLKFLSPILIRAQKTSMIGAGSIQIWHERGRKKQIRVTQYWKCHGNWP